MTEEENETIPSTVDTSVEEEEMEDAPEANEEKPSQRLMITKMELENFKSYGGVKEIGPFHKCFSAVVGPNGSGKSNVIDAMLFVFGKRAKKLRLNKVSELIHKSDAVKNNPPTSARVSVFFQEIIDHGEGDNNFDVVPDTQMVVTRIAKQDNSSTYKLGGKNCSFREVSAYLGSKGIDLDNNRFLILQGEVEMISMMAPKGKTEDDDGLLEYLEDIIGSSKYVEDTNLAAQKVEQLTEQRQEKLNRVKAVEKEKDNLEGAKQEAEALLGKDREIRRKRNILFQINSMKETKAIESLTEKKTVTDEKLAAEKEKASGTKNEVKKLEKRLNAQSKEYDKICTELKTTKDEFTAYERREIKLQGEIKHAKGSVKKAQTKLTTETKKEADATKKIEAAQESIPELEDQRDELVERRQKRTTSWAQSRTKSTKPPRQCAPNWKRRPRNWHPSTKSCRNSRTSSTRPEPKSIYWKNPLVKTRSVLQSPKRSWLPWTDDSSRRRTKRPRVRPTWNRHRVGSKKSREKRQICSAEKTTSNKRATT